MMNRTVKMLTIGMIAIATALCGEMEIFEFYSDLWEISHLRSGEATTEECAFFSLSQYPVNADVDYIAVPWTSLIKTGGYKDPDVTKGFQTENGFTICQHIRYKKIFPALQRMGVRVLFSPHATTEQKVDGLEIVPFPFEPYVKIEPAPVKNIFCSFVGTEWTHPIRKEIGRVLTGEEYLIILRTGAWSLNIRHAHKRKRHEEQYRDIMARSRFALVPRGTGVGSVRIWESLSAGAIPVLIADGLALPYGTDWDSCIVRVNEDAIDTIPEVLSRITLEQEAQMRQNCLDASERYTGKNLYRAVQEYYSTLN